MKKIYILCVLILTMLVSTAFAQNINEDKWFWTYSTDTISIYIDKQNIKYNPENDSVTLWIRGDEPAKNLVTMKLMQIYYTDNTISEYDFAVYQKGNQNPLQTGDTGIRKKKIIPNTLGEALKEKSLTLIDRDKELAEYKEQQEAEAKQQEQEQKDKEKEQRNKEITNTAIGIIGSLF